MSTHSLHQKQLSEATHLKHFQTKIKQALTIIHKEYKNKSILLKVTEMTTT